MNTPATSPGTRIIPTAPTASMPGSTERAPPMPTTRMSHGARTSCTSRATMLTRP